MNSSDLERLLLKRGERLDNEGALSAGAEAQVYAELKRDAAAKHGPSRSGWLAGLLLAAAAITFLVIWPWPSNDFGRATCQLALLDRAGRPLETVVRSSPRDDFQRPSAVLVEYVATEKAFVRIAVVDALGFLLTLDLGPMSDQPVEAGSDGIVSLELDEFKTNGASDSLVSILLISSTELIPAERLADCLPHQIDNDLGGNRTRTLKSLAHTLESELGCTVLFETFTLEHR